MLRPWPWGACWGSGLGPGVPAGEGVWRVWRVLEGVWRVWKVLEGLEGLDGFGGCLEGLEGFGGFGGFLEGLEGLEGFGGFAGWQTAALKANRKPLLWPWSWGACLRSGLGPGVPVGEGVWRVWRVLEGLEGFGGCLEGLEGFGGFAGWQTVPLKAHRKLCCGLGPGVPVGEVALALGCLLGRVFGGFGGFWRVFGGFGRFWRVWRVEGGPTGQVPHLRWSQAPPRPWRRPGSADIYYITHITRN